LAGAKVLAEVLQRPGAAEGAGPAEAGGVDVLTGGTDVHLVLVDLRAVRPELTGRQAEDRLHAIGVTVNRNAIPFDPRPPIEASGLRIGTPALATRGLGESDFAEVARVIAAALGSEDFESDRSPLSERVQTIVERHPLYEGMAAGVVPGMAEVGAGVA
ncbi:MAG: hypothetical protein KGJ43_02100, partial [Acidobacteriota bacterium]|nr:hypothetical protein [Acidobacteriota bacterium]